MLAIFAVAIPTSTALLARSAGTRARLHALAAGAIHDALGLDAQIGRVSLQLLPLTIIGRDLVLDDPVYGRFAEVEELRIQPSFRALLRGVVDLHEIEIRGATLRLVIRNGQVRNLPRADAPPTQEDDGPLLPFGSLRIVDSTVVVNAEPHASAQLSDIELTLREEARTIHAELHRAEGWVRHRHGEDRIERLEARVALALDRALSVEHLLVESPVLRVHAQNARATLPFEEHGYSGELEVRYDLEHLARLPLPPEVTLPPMRGQVEVTARVSSDDALQRARGALTLEGVRIEQFGLGERARILFDADRERVRILSGSAFQIPHDGGTVEVEGDIALAPEWGFPVHVRARPRELSFAGLMSDLGVTENAIVEWMFNGELVLDGGLLPLALEGPVDLRTHDFRVTHGPYHERPIRRVIGVSEGRFTGRWSIRPDAVRFEDLVGELPRSRLRADVLLGFDNALRVRARTEALDLTDITPLDRWPVAGVGEARVSIEGRFQDPVVTGHVRLSDFRFDDFRLGHLESDAVLDPDGMGVRFPMVQAVKNESRYRAENLYLDFHDERFAMSGLVHLDGMLLTDFYQVFGFQEDERVQPYRGLARGRADLRYTNGHPGDSPSGTLDVGMDLGFDWATLDGYGFREGRLIGHFRWLDWARGARGAELSLTHLSLAKGEGTVTVDGRMGLGGQLQLQALADRIALSELEGIGERLPGVRGVASVIGRIGGTFDVMRADFDVGLTNVSYAGRAIGDGRLSARLTDREDPWVVEARRWDREELPEDEPCAHARTGLAYSDWPADPPLRTIDGPEERLLRPMAFLLCGEALEGRLSVDLAVGRTEALPLRGRLRVDDLDLSGLLPRAPDGRAVDGHVTGDVTIAGGALRAPETLEGSVSLRDLRFARDDLELHNARPVELVFKNGQILVNQARFIGPDSRLRVRGRASLEEGLALQVDADVSLAIVARLSEAVTSSSGRLRAQLRVTGPFADPELYGRASVTGGSFRLAALGTPIDDVQGRIGFSQRSVLLEELRASVAGGRLVATGEAALREQELERYSFDVEASGVRHALAEGVDATFGTRARLAWARGERLPLLSGEVQVARLTYERGMELRGLLGEVAARATQGLFRSERAEVRRYDPDQDSVRLDLRVTQDETFRVQNNLVDAEVRIQSDERPFRIVGTDQRFGLRGTMTLPRGRLFFQNNEFDVRRGVIRFDDSTRIEPHVDIEAVTEVRRASDLSAPSWRVILTLTGPSDNLQLRTQSEPALPEPDILMLLAFGMTSGELQQLQQGGDLAGAAAIEALSAITGVDREVRRALPLIDDLRVTTGYSMRTGRSEPRVSVGRRIADRVRLSATTGLSESREVRAAVEVQLDRSQRIGVSYDNYDNTSANSLGNLGVDWGIRLEFE